MFAVIQLERSWSMDRDSASNTAPAHLYTAARRMEARWIAGDPSARSGLSQIRTAILEHESGTGGSNLESTGHSLQPPASGEAVLCYWLDDDASWLWLWTPQGLEIARLAPKKAIVDAAIRFRDAVASDTPEQAEMGKRLLHLLLGNLEQRALRIPRWNIVGDEGLFHIPYAALPVGDRSYLVEKVEVRMIPNALRTRPRGTPRRSALAIADPVLNRADERTPADLFHRASGRHWAYELPRLPGTAIEADQVLSSWRKAGFATVLHTGLLSTEEAVVQRFANDAPSVIHIATHTASPAGDDDQPRLVLSLHDDGSPGLLTAEDIASLRVPAEIVVLSACRSAGGPVSGHSGVFGLTRAWMVAGVRQVIATLWPIGDHAAKFQSTLHEHLSTTAEDGSFDASTALRQTQLVCLRMPAPFSRPKYWAGSVLLARR
jgi:CHAT domain-containing protein